MRLSFHMRQCHSMPPSGSCHSRRGMCLVCIKPRGSNPAMWTTGPGLPLCSSTQPAASPPLIHHSNLVPRVRTVSKKSCSTSTAPGMNIFARLRSVSDLFRVAFMQSQRRNVTRVGRCRALRLSSEVSLSTPTIQHHRSKKGATDRHFSC